MKKTLIMNTKKTWQTPQLFDCQAERAGCLNAQQSNPYMRLLAEGLKCRTDGIIKFQRGILTRRCCCAAMRCDFEARFFLSFSALF